MLEAKCVWDNFDENSQNRHHHPLSFNISVGHQHSKDVTNIEILSPTPQNCHQHLCSQLNLLSMFGGSLFQSNVSWAMQYGTMKKEACVNECMKINHDIPSIHFIETERLKSIVSQTFGVKNLGLYTFTCIFLPLGNGVKFSDFLVIYPMISISMG